MRWNSRGGAYADAVGLARGSSHAIPPWPGQEAHEEKFRVAHEALATYFLAKSVAPMLVTFLAVLVDPRRQYHNF